MNAALILLRGLPGSGKSTLAEILSEEGKYPIHSIDSYFVDPVSGEYCFNFRENHHAYKRCEESTKKSMELGYEKIFVDNTFTLEWEMEPYFGLAGEYQYRVFVVTVEKRHEGENIHLVGRDQLEKMAAKYKVKLL